MITLEAHRCDTGVTYNVTFLGTDAEAEAQAVAYIKARGMTHAIHELVLFEERWVNEAHGGDDFYRQDVPTADQPYAIDADRFPALYDVLNPVCEHGASRWLCYGPAHYARPEEIAQGW